MSKSYDEKNRKTNTNRKKYGDVTKEEYRRWIKWLRGQGFSGPFAELKNNHECVKLLYKELRKNPPTIIETHPRDKRTITSALTRFERQRRRVKIASVIDYNTDCTREILDNVHQLQIHQEMIIAGIPKYLSRLTLECNTPGILICSQEFLQRRKLSWYVCSHECGIANQQNTLCENFESCMYKNSSLIKHFELYCRADDKGKFQIQLPSRCYYPEFETIFPALSNIQLYKEICRFEDLGTIWLQECIKLLSYIEAQENEGAGFRTKSAVGMQGNSDFQRKLELKITEPALKALEAWNNQAKLIQPWQRLFAQ